MRNALMAIAVTSMAISAPAAADPWKDESGHGRYENDDRRYYRSGNGIRYWRGDDGRYYCRRSNGTTGLIIGAAAGALAGRAIDTQGDRTLGTLLGGAAGALLGREVERSTARCR